MGSSTFCTHGQKALQGVRVINEYLSQTSFSAAARFHGVLLVACETWSHFTPILARIFVGVVA
jgi:hypothetical protein